jgi:hypothetical protein
MGKLQTQQGPQQGTQEINAYVKARIALVKAIDQAEKEEL